MTQLKTSFAGLSLRNPVIISSSSLTNSAEKNKKLELAGAGVDGITWEKVGLRIRALYEEVLKNYGK